MSHERRTSAQGSGSHGRKDSRSDEFEMCPRWGPGMDKRRRSPRISLKALLVERFDQRASWPAKVRNVSRLGSQPFLSIVYKRIEVSMYEFCTCGLKV